MAVLIALLGLVGVATFNVERRTREISIRKVLGADVRDVVGLLTREFLVLPLGAVGTLTDPENHLRGD
jgi:putative ABC transport system permease protein